MLALCLASRRSRRSVSGAHLPPTSQPSSTSLPPSPSTSSGYCVAFRVLAARSRSPSVASVPRMGLPSARSGDTIVASPHMGTPPYTGRSYATTSIRRPSSTASMLMSISRSCCCGTTRAPASLSILRQMRSSATALRWRRPLLEQATKWSPKVSQKLRQDRPGQRRLLSKSRRRSLRRSATWKRDGWSLVSVEVGRAVSQ